MAELDAISIKNPTSEDFVQHYNGEPYTIKAGEEKAFVTRVAFHLAKHLATKMINDDIPEKDHKDPKKTVSIAQRLVYDNEYLRIALYKILGNIELVKSVVMAYPYKGWVGDMKVYESFVAKEQSKNIVPEKVPEKTEETKK